MVVHEVDSLGLNGPSGGSIVAMGIREVLGVVSTFVPRDLIRPAVTIQHVRARSVRAPRGHPLTVALGRHASTVAGEPARTRASERLQLGIAPGTPNLSGQRGGAVLLW